MTTRASSRTTKASSKASTAPMDVDKTNDPLTEAIEKIVEACEARKDSYHSAVFEGSPASSVASPAVSPAIIEQGGGPLTSPELLQLSRLCTSLAIPQNENLDFGAVEGDLLASLFPSLEEHVHAAACVDLVKEASQAKTTQWLKGTPGTVAAGPGMQRVFILKNGLEAAFILLSIMTSPNVARRAISEDAIEACLALIRHHFTKNVVPALGNTGHLETTDPSPRKKQKRVSGESADLKHVYKLIFTTVNPLLQLYERLDALILSVPLDDQPVLTLSSTVMSVFTIEPLASEASLCNLLQVASIGLLTTIFHKYPRHRNILLEDLFPLMLKLPTSKRSLRTFMVPNHEAVLAVSTIKQALFSSSEDGRLYIQAITALILSMIQSCIERPSFAAQGELQAGGLAQCQGMCNFFASHLLQRCSRKGQDGGASEYRPILAHLVDDLLSLVLLPDYPAAGMLLLTIDRILANDVLKVSSVVPHAKTNVESTYLSTAFDVLGKIAAGSARILSAHRQVPLKILKAASKGKQPDSATNGCYCGRTTYVNTFMVNCDNCREFFHGECVGESRDSVSQVWFCDYCRLGRMVTQEVAKFAEKTSRQFGPVDDSHIFRQLLLNHMSQQSESNQFATQVHLAQWVEDICTAAESNDDEDGSHARVLCDFFMDQWDKPQSLSAPPAQAVGESSNRCLNDEGNLRLMITLAATKSELICSFPSQIGLLLQLMADDGQVSLRKLSVKAISQVIEADPTLMLKPAVKKAVSLRFDDDAKSVREASVALVGSFVMQTPEVANAFHSPLLQCLGDEGVSVKKRAIKILRSVLLSNPMYKGRAAACAVMLRQASDPKEDDSVRDLIHEFFTELWLANNEPPSVSVTNPPPPPNGTRGDSSPRAADSNVPQQQVPNQPAGTGIVTPLTPNGSTAFSTKDAKKQSRNEAGRRSPEKSRGYLAAEQMTEVVIAANGKDVLTALLKELMYGFSDSDKDKKNTERKKRQAAVLSHCSLLVDSLFEQLLVLEENRSVLGDSFGTKLVGLVRSIAVFSEVAVADVLRHLDTIIPYLKADNNVSREQESHIVSEVCDMVFRMAPIMTDRDIASLEEGSVVDDLVKITYRFGSGPLSSSMHALSGLANRKTDDTDCSIKAKLMKLVTTFYSYLVKTKRSGYDILSRDVKTRSNVSRALSVLGAFCRNHEADDDEWPDEDKQDAAEIDPQDLSAANAAYACYCIFVDYLQQPDVATKCNALRALTGVFISRPRVMLALEQDGTISDIMSKDSPPDLQIESLLCWRDILLAEEKRVESGDAKANMDAKTGITVSKKVSGDQDGDAVLMGGVIAQHSSRLLQMTTCQDQRVRFSVLNLLGDLLRQGMLNPMETVPFLFAMQGDVESPKVRSLALKLLIVEAEKRPDMIRQRVAAGVRQAYIFQRKVNKDLEVTAVVKRNQGKSFEVESIFADVFKECIRSSKKQRRGLYRNLLSLFSLDDGYEEGPGQKTKNGASRLQELPHLSFAAQVLAHLPYNTANDPLFIIYHVSSIAALQGPRILEQLAAFLRKYGLSSSDELDDDNTEEDLLEQAAKLKSPRRKKDVAVVNKANFDKQRFAELCAKASALVLLLRLKCFLRKNYNLSETRCLEFSPDAKERVSDKGLSTSPDMPVFDCQTSSKDLDMNIRLYAEFRALMRAEGGSDARMSDSGGDSDSNDPASRKRKGTEADTLAD